MKPLLNLFFFCCRDKKDKNSTVTFIKDSKEIEKIEKTTNDLKFASLDEPDKTIENNATDKKSQLKIRQSRHKPSIILSIDGSAQQVVLFEDNAKKKKKKNKKSKKKHSKHSKSSKNPIAQ